MNALKSQKNFENFKRSYSYRQILEHGDKESGAQYLSIVAARENGVLQRSLKTVLIEDDVGNPIKYRYPNIDIPLSPATLRYVKIASDLEILFGSNLGIVREIGCGYGGQALVNDQVLNVERAILYDLPCVNELIERYLNSFLLRGSYRTAVLNQETAEKSDLVISNYAFSELPKELQKAYVAKVLCQSDRGYLIMNSGIGGSRSKGKLELSELRKLLPDFDVLEEEPLSANFNYVIVWGHDKIRCRKHFQEKEV